MNTRSIYKILKDTEYVRMGGSDEELKAANYLKDYTESLGISAWLEDFPVQMADIIDAHLYADGVEIPAKAYYNCGSGEIEAPFMYLPSTDPVSLYQAKGKIVLIDAFINYEYDALIKAEVAGIITYNGNLYYRDSDIDQMEMREAVSKGNKILIMNVNAKEAVKLVKNNPSKIRISIKQHEYEGNSRNVVAEIPGTTDEWLVCTAHYDSRYLTVGAYDNMTGCIALLGIMEEMKKKAPHRYGIRFVFCGSEERGLLGAKAYVKQHEEELPKIALNINVDMIGTIMGDFLACTSAETSLVDYIRYRATMKGFGIDSYQGVYSSDSTPFAYAGVPALSFARIAGNNIAPIHNRYDTMKVLSPKRILSDIVFITDFVKEMADAVLCPVSREIPENIQKDLDDYINIRKKNKR